MRIVKYFMLVVGLLFFSSSIGMKEKIRLMVGNVQSTRSISIVHYVEASLSSRTVEVCFQEPFGNVQVKIVSSCGEVIESQSIDTSSMYPVSIEIPSKEEDSYTLTIETSRGTLEGKFIL